MTDQQPSLAYKTKQIIKKYEFAFKKNFGRIFLWTSGCLTR